MSDPSEFEYVPNFGRDGFLPAPQYAVNPNTPGDIEALIIFVKDEDLTRAHCQIAWPLVDKNDGSPLVYRRIHIVREKYNRRHEKAYEEELNAACALATFEGRSFEEPSRYVRPYAGFFAKHLTNWGPVSEVVERSVLGEKVIGSLGVLSLEKRQGIEGIASAMRVRKPNGEWNCQSWQLEVLEEAVAQGVLTSAQCAKAYNEVGRTGSWHLSV